MKELLALRALIKKKKPHFKRYDAGKKARLSFSWRSVRAKQNKIGRKGYPRAPAVGYSSPASVRGFSRLGLAQILVSNIKDLDSIDAKTQGAILSAGLGDKKRVELLKTAQEKKITILNFKDPQGFIKSVEEKLASKKVAKTAKVAKAKAAAPKKDAKADKQEESKDESEKKADGVKQQEKIITQKQ